MDETPGIPAPETAWRVATRTSLNPKASCRGLSASTSPMVEQLGFVMMPPVPVAVAVAVGAASAAAAAAGRRHGWCGRSAKCSGFTSGIRSGTCGWVLWLRAFEMTRRPSAACRASTSPATCASSAEKTTVEDRGSSGPSTIRSATDSGSGVV